MNPFVEHHQQSIRFQYSSFDRMLLNAVVQPMQQPAMIVGFLDKCRQVPSITKAYFRGVSEDYHRFVGRLAATQHVEIGVHRRMVREAIASSIPMRLPAKERPRPTISPVAGFIDQILEADRQAPRKQRHTAHRIWVRISRERSSCPIAESTVRQYVRQRKRTLGVRVVPEAFVPQQYAWGDEAQVDWYEAGVDLDGDRVTVQVFAMRSMASGAAFHRAYRPATQQAFLEAHELGVQFPGGSFRRLRYDNLG